MNTSYIGSSVYIESNGRGLHAFPRPAIGGMKLAALGVEDYVYVCFKRGTSSTGAHPMLPASFPVSYETLQTLRSIVREHLANIDAGKVEI